MTTRRVNYEKKCREAEEALSKCQSMATAGQFAAAIMHEINSPLAAISNLAYLVHYEADHADKVREYILLLEDQLANVRRIANQTLSFYKPAGALQATDLVPLVEAALRVHEQKISAKQVRLLKSLPVNATVTAHSGEMLQVISNLIANALDALPTNGNLSLRVRKCQREVHLTIADDGHGIPDAILAKVFDPFFTTKKERGTGLGLAISKAIVERHSGRIRTRSSVRHGRSGTAFRVSLPLDRSAQTAGSSS